MMSEVALVCKAGLEGNLTDGQIAFAEETGCALDPAPNQVLMHRYSQRLPEQALEVGDAQPSNSGDVVQ